MVVLAGGFFRAAAGLTGRLLQESIPPWVAALEGEVADLSRFTGWTRAEVLRLPIPIRRFHIERLQRMIQEPEA